MIDRHRETEKERLWEIIIENKELQNVRIQNDRGMNCLAYQNYLQISLNQSQSICPKRKKLTLEK